MNASLSTHAKDAKAATVMPQMRMRRDVETERPRKDGDSILGCFSGEALSPWVTGTPGHDDGRRWVPRNVFERPPLAVMSHPKEERCPFLICSRAAPSTPHTQCVNRYSRDADWIANRITETSGKQWVCVATVT